MKNILATGFMMTSFLMLAGAGCAPKTTPPATPSTPPAAQAPTPTPTPTPEPSVTAAKVDGLTQDDLNRLKLDVEALQTQDLTTIKN